MARAIPATSGLRIVPPCVGNGWLTTAIPRGAPSGMRSVPSRHPAIRRGSSLNGSASLSRGRSVAGRVTQWPMVRGIRPIGRALLLVVLFASCASGRGSAGGATHPDGAPELIDTVIQSGLSVPWDIAFAPDGRMFMTERMGNIVMFESAKPKAKRTAVMKVPDVHSMVEAGLMGIALDPAFATNGFLYVCASRMD